MGNVSFDIVKVSWKLKSPLKSHLKCHLKSHLKNHLKSHLKSPLKTYLKSHLKIHSKSHGNICELKESENHPFTSFKDSGVVGALSREEQEPGLTITLFLIDFWVKRKSYAILLYYTRNVRCMQKDYVYGSKNIDAYYLTHSVCLFNTYIQLLVFTCLYLFCYWPCWV